tara:strand:+ start:6454 stop:8664 length:2211 start_codon:yes stop_codon:yes gene_type:complete
MLASTELRRDLVLVGGGHSHALALRMLAMHPIEGVRITLVSPASHTPYSGMLPGLVAGHYSFEDAHIDLARLSQWAGVRFIAGEVTALDPRTRRLTLAGRPALRYDLLGIDIGCQPELASVPGAAQYVVPVKPVAGFWQRWREIEAQPAHSAAAKYRIGIVGGGAGGVELALSMAHRLAGKAVVFDLWCGAPAILAGYNRRSQRAVMRALARAGVSVHVNARVSAVEAGQLSLEGGSQAAFDALFWCTGAAPAGWIAASGLATDSTGFVAVRDTLQSLDDERIFAAGDIATQVNHPRPKAGVFAVRQAPVLAYNLRAALLGRPLREHRPQRRFLSLLSLGTQSATADRGPWSATGRWVWRWKDRIDRNFMARFGDLPARMSEKPAQRLPELSPAGQAPCGGCGAKVGASPLARALGALAAQYPQHCVGEVEDAVRVPPHPGDTLLQSLDVLRQIVADPWLMGRIAALHALSDLYACGARPLSALAALTLPFASEDMLERDLYQLLAGALHEFQAADCRLAGGHSMQGTELSLGFAVNGTPLDANGRVLGKTGGAAGDALVLTKALGTGVVFAAHMQLCADGRDVDAAIRAMLNSNGPAAALALQHSASACTDITGFGLLGHLLEMLGAGGAAELRLSQLPLLPGVAALLHAGTASSMHAANVAGAGDQLKIAAGVDLQLAQILFDPQTSGGLLISLPEQHAHALCAALRSAGYGDAVVIGRRVADAGKGAGRVSLL